MNKLSKLTLLKLDFAAARIRESQCWSLNKVKKVNDQLLILEIVLTTKEISRPG